MTKTISALFLLVFLAICTSAGPGKRAKRGFNNSGYGGNNGRGGYGDSNYRDASVSREDNGQDCSDENQNSGSREVAYNRDGRQSERYPSGRSFARSSATASATSSNQANNVVI